MIHIRFDKGTLLISNLAQNLASIFPYLKWDIRVSAFRAMGYHYRNIILGLRKEQIVYQDEAKDFLPQNFSIQMQIEPRAYQTQALNAWLNQQSNGVVVLPTGAGKTILAVLAIAKIQRPTLIHVPTIDLMTQWYDVLLKFFGTKIGLLGGGYNQPENITVATYDSALIHVPSKGNKFGFLIFDECHHLPSEQMQYTALSSIAPFRLALTATPERSDGKEKLLYELCGGICYQTDIKDLEGKTLAPYEIITLEVEMSETEKKQYQEYRQIYLNFIRKNNINFQQKNGWQQFIQLTCRTSDGKEAFAAYLKQKKLSQSSENKLNYVWDIILKHRTDRVLIFTQDNETAYSIGKSFYLPVLTHHTKVKEREQFLTLFRQGVYNILVTSKVLNEGVDVPEANVAVVVSGSGTVREHVQRLGRILRAKEGKKAILYELISAGTSEYFVNQRRKMHSAYEKRTSEL
ncbi:DEAD/DEAH box helicase family protein [Pigmentibacter sp. JX0631]|uniref:DEAD/DEAH box helicase n=1 Tax=Pigmentibacter sp. JX0631 TaxID=2976982 RepID=UPI0024683C7C|nr:DEAD/DEAH box helicase family protein [Pigmentibacter sp. JX0631]WGL60590.1 DEAD/DEAH box helicase family protein [Pigmentibacter sp. JX0631]